MHLHMRVLRINRALCSNPLPRHGQPPNCRSQLHLLARLALTIYTGCSPPARSEPASSSPVASAAIEGHPSRLTLGLAYASSRSTLATVCMILLLGQAAGFTVKAPPTEAASGQASRFLPLSRSSPLPGCHQALLPSSCKCCLQCSLSMSTAPSLVRALLSVFSYQHVDEPPASIPRFLN